MDYFQKWFDELMTESGIVWKPTISARGECRRHTGPSTWFAAVKINVSPSSKFEVEDQLEPMTREQVSSLGWYDQIIFGVLDVMFTRPVVPLREFKLTILEVESNEVESTPKAFRLAARNAAMKLLDLYAK